MEWTEEGVRVRRRAERTGVGSLVWSRARTKALCTSRVLFLLMRSLALSRHARRQQQTKNRPGRTGLDPSVPRQSQPSHHVLAQCAELQVFTS
eukprot:1453996-Rhodomonas_salina.2